MNTTTPRQPYAPARHCTSAGALASAVVMLALMIYAALDGSSANAAALFTAAFMLWMATTAGAFAGFLVYAPAIWLLGALRIARPPAIVALWLLPTLLGSGGRPLFSVLAFAWGLIACAVFCALEQCGRRARLPPQPGSATSPATACPPCTPESAR